MHELVVDGEESMPVKHLLIPVACGVHLTLRVVADDVIEVEQLRDGHEAVERLDGGMGLVTREENAVIVLSLDKSVNSIAECSNGRSDHRPILILKRLWLLDTDSSTGDGLVINAGGVVDGESNVSHRVTMDPVVSSELLVLLVGCGEDEGDVVAAHDMGSIGSFTSLESLQTCDIINRTV